MEPTLPKPLSQHQVDLCAGVHKGVNAADHPFVDGRYQPPVNPAQSSLGMNALWQHIRLRTEPGALLPARCQLQCSNTMLANERDLGVPTVTAQGIFF